MTAYKGYVVREMKDRASNQHRPFVVQHGAGFFLRNNRAEIRTFGSISTAMAAIEREARR